MAWSLKPDRPIYLQLMEQIEIKIISGEYVPGEKIPSVRDLASEAAVNPNTMQKALAELERKGIINTHRTAGRYIAEDEQMLKELKNSIAQERAKEFVDSMEKMGFADCDILEFIQNVVESEMQGGIKE
jgi:GntR family transcriptional regulator